MLTIQNLSYRHPNRDLLFDHISLTVNANEKVALIGANGVGKSTLLKLIAGELQPSEGELSLGATCYYIPQVFGQYNQWTVAKALGVEQKLDALNAILEGSVVEENYELLNDDWTIEERCIEALAHWKLGDVSLNQRLGTLSGGQKTKIFLAGISIHQPKIVLLDEPSNHLDREGRALLYDFVRHVKCTLLVVSHDRKLLRLLNAVCELSRRGVLVYGGGYEFYVAQKEVERQALAQDIQSKEKTLKKAREKERETLERQQKLDSRGKGKQQKAGIPRIVMKTMQNSAEKSTAKIKGVHAEKIEGIVQELQDLRASVSEIDKMKFGFNNSKLHKGKILFVAEGINFSHGNEELLWDSALHFQIVSGERIAIKGNNGSGKTTLVNIILGRFSPKIGIVSSRVDKAMYIDQDYSLLNNELTVYEQAQRMNASAMLEHEVKIRLNRFLFPRDSWDKPCHTLSGGERMRLLLCGLTIGSQSPDVILLDEPTNNLDIQNMELLTRALNEYEGTLLVISHDETFLEQLRIERTIELSV